MDSLKVPYSLSSLPEELIARILTNCVTPQVPLLRPSSYISPPYLTLVRPSPSNISRTRLSPLLVSRQFFRIGAPLYYHTLYLPSVTHAASVLEVLSAQPPLADAVRCVVLGCISLEGARILQICRRIEDLDICVDVGTEVDDFRNVMVTGDANAEALCDALERIDMKRFTLRRAPYHDAYLTNTRPKYVLKRVAEAVPHWPNLEYVHYDKMGVSPVMMSLAHALSNAPKLRIVKAYLPAMWNDLLLTISQNSALKYITLYVEGPEVVMHTSLYMLEARKHARLSELIKAGTPFMRMRAHYDYCCSAELLDSPGRRQGERSGC